MCSGTSTTSSTRWLNPRPLGDGPANRRPHLPGANSPFTIVTHCLGVMEFWAGAMIAGRPIVRNRDAEFTATGAVEELVTACSAGACSPPTSTYSTPSPRRAARLPARRRPPLRHDPGRRCPSHPRGAGTTPRPPGHPRPASRRGPSRASDPVAHGDREAERHDGGAKHPRADEMDDLPPPCRRPCSSATTTATNVHATWPEKARNRLATTPITNESACFTALRRGEAVVGEQPQDGEQHDAQSRPEEPAVDGGEEHAHPRPPPPGGGAGGPAAPTRLTPAGEQLPQPVLPDEQPAGEKDQEWHRLAEVAGRRW